MKQPPLRRGAIAPPQPHGLTPFVAGLVFVATFILYFRTAGPTLGGGFDSEEFQHAAYTLSVAHATGYPLYLLLGKLVITILPFGNVAYRMNLLSAILGAAAGALVYLTAWQITRRQLASVVTSALFVTNAAVWRQAGVASIGPLHLLLTTAILSALLLWHAKRAPLMLAALLFGLGLAHHRTVLFLAPGIVVFVLLVDPGILRRPRELAKNALALFAPLLLYLYIPLRASASPWYWNTWEGFVSEISGGDADAFIRSTPSQIAEGAGFMAQYLGNAFGFIGVAIILLGVGALALQALRRDHNQQDESQASPLPVAILLSLLTLAFTSWGAIYAGEPDRYLAMGLVFTLYWFALGIQTMQDWVAAHVSSNWTRVVSLASVAVFVALPTALTFPDHFRTADWSGNYRVYKQWDEIFTLPLPDNAIVVGNWPQINAMRYMQRVEQRRPDLSIVGTYIDPAPQTEAAQMALAEGRAIYLSPGIALPTGSFRYSLLGPLLQVHASGQTPSPEISVHANGTRVDSSLILADHGLATALEPYAPTTSIAAGRTVRVSLTWYADGGMQDFLVRLRLYDPEGRLVSQKDDPPVRGLDPPSHWIKGKFVSDVQNFLIPAGTPPGNYMLTMTVVDSQTKAGTSGEIPLGELAVTPGQNIRRDEVFIQHMADIALDHNVAIAGYGGLDGTHHTRGQLSFYLVWMVRENVNADLNVRLALVDSAGKAVKDWTLPPLAFYPTRLWRAGEWLKAYYDLALGDLPAGTYTLTVGIDAQAQKPVASIQIAP